MRSNTLPGRLLIAAALITMAAIPASSQEHARPAGAGIAGDEPEVVSRFKSELGHQALDYWTVKLNGYKVRIDEVLPPNDLAELNRLRVRWGLLLEEMFQAKGGGKASFGVNAEGTNATKSDDESIEIEVNGEQMLERASEIMDIYAGAKSIAARNAGTLGGLRESVGGDLTGFLGQVVESGQSYRARNAAEIEAAGAASEFAWFDGKEHKELAGELRSEKGKKGFDQIYGFGIEPIVLLYNGMEIRHLLEEAMPASAKVAGLTLPESAVLQQNFPNPARTSTRIDYRLPESSSGTLLRVFDAGGVAVATHDLGAQTAGEHGYDLDVADLASGSYLYQLTIQTSKGQQVYAKVMRVVR